MYAVLSAAGLTSPLIDNRRQGILQNSLNVPLTYESVSMSHRSLSRTYIPGPRCHGFSRPSCGEYVDSASSPSGTYNAPPKPRHVRIRAGCLFYVGRNYHLILTRRWLHFGMPWTQSRLTVNARKLSPPLGIGPYTLWAPTASSKLAVVSKSGLHPRGRRSR